MLQVTPKRLKSGHGDGVVSLLLALVQIAGLVVDTVFKTLSISKYILNV
jgi:hypothetical protein